MEVRREPSPQELRLAVKRAFTRYYLDLWTEDIADPTDAYEACSAYLAMRLRERGLRTYRREIEKDTSAIAGEIEQDLLRQYRNIRQHLADQPIGERFRECVERGWERVSKD